MHPLISDLASLKDSEVESKIQELTKKYFMSNNVGLQMQIAAALNAYKEEMANRQQAAYQKMMESRNKDLDKLININ